MKRHNLVAGIDEVGMGAIAGPIVVAVAAFWTKQEKINGVNDSKKLTREQRETLFPIIINATRSFGGWFGVGFALPSLIDDVGIHEAWQYAARMALDGAPEFANLYVDGEIPVVGYSGLQTVKPKADSLYWECSAASILAKVIHDRDMTEMSLELPGYGFMKNVGYGTSKHYESIQRLGASNYHRKSFINKTGPKRDLMVVEDW